MTKVSHRNLNLGNTKLLVWMQTTEPTKHIKSHRCLLYTFVDHQCHQRLYWMLYLDKTRYFCTKCLFVWWTSYLILSCDGHLSLDERYWDPLKYLTNSAWREWPIEHTKQWRPLFIIFQFQGGKNFNCLICKTLFCSIIL